MQLFSVTIKMAERQDLRVDCTALYNVSRQNYLIIINVTYPLHIVTDEAAFRIGLIKTANYLTTTFGQTPSIRYQVNASFYLRHRESNDLRLFTGSFFLQGNKYLSLSGPVFINFDATTFPDSVLRTANLDHAKTILTWNDSDSIWAFHNIHAIIVSFQLSKAKDHPFLMLHHLHAPRRSQRRRRHVTFNL